MTPPLVLTGANGFIGRHFLAACRNSDRRIRALTRSIKPLDGSEAFVDWVMGNLDDPTIWLRLLEPGCTVVNLAYSQVAATADAVTGAREMVEACAAVGARRLVHCSTISVFGRSTGGVIDEVTPCNPIDAYGCQKLAIEEAILGADARSCEVAILRPAAVFGSGGQALRSLCASLAGGSRLTNYGRSSLFGCRSMHLVPVETVVAALLFLADPVRSFDRDVFIVAEDDDPLNNFRDVERILMTALGFRDYPLPPLPLPSVVLKVLLQARGRSEIDPYCRYTAAKLHAAGFASPVSFAAALQAFAENSLAASSAASIA